MAIGLWILLAVLVLAVIIIVYYFNRLVLLSQRIKNSLSQIDVQLKKRADLVPNLMETVKGYVKYEKSIMDKVVEARKALLGAGDIVKKMKAGNELNSAIGRLFAIAENYPQLKANEGFLSLQSELAAIEDKISYARQYYNDSILSYNTACTTFPGLMFAKIFGKTEQKYLEIPEEQKAVPQVKF